MHRTLVKLGCLLSVLTPIHAQTPEIKQERQLNYERAKKLLEADAAKAAATSGDQVVATGSIWTKLGDLARTNNKTADAKAAYTKAVAILGNRIDAAAPLIGLGISAILDKDDQRALQLLNQASLLDPAHGGQASMWSAVAHNNLQQIAQAEAGYRSAISLQDPQSPAAATTMDLFAAFLRAQNRSEEAVSCAKQANSIRSAYGARKSASLPKTAGIGRVGGGTLAPNLVYKSEPEYSDEARAAKFQGSVVMSIEIWEDGTVHNLHVVRGLGLGLDEAAVEAVSRWRFKPATRDNLPVKVIANIEVNFRLL